MKKKKKNTNKKVYIKIGDNIYVKAETSEKINVSITRQIHNLTYNFFTTSVLDSY